jgi:soluble lytic murein transglycosylase-like protein
MINDSLYDSLISKWSNIFDVPFNLIKAIIAKESTFNPDAKNPSSTATGLMQLLRGTAAWMSGGASVDLKDPNTNISLGTKYLSILMKKNKGDLEHSIADYYAGTAYKDENGRWYRLTAGGVRNYDVNTYVDKVLGLYRKYSGSSVSPVAAPDSPLPGLPGSGSGADSALVLLGVFVGAMAFTRLIRRKDVNNA